MSLGISLRFTPIIYLFFCRVCHFFGPGECQENSEVRGESAARVQAVSPLLAWRRAYQGEKVGYPQPWESLL